MMYLLKLIIPHIATNSYYKITKFDKKIKPCKAFGVLGCQTSERPRIKRFDIHPGSRQMCLGNCPLIWFDLIDSSDHLFLLIRTK